MVRKISLLLFICLVVTVVVFFLKSTGDTIGAHPKAEISASVGCLKCHEGIEQISDVPAMAELTCVQCHMGNSDGKTIENAHEGMWANPADFRVVDNTCGTCHADIVESSKKSLHATSAGKISGARYSWGAQRTRNAIYATYDVEDKDGNIPKERGALKSLKQLPLYDPTKPMSMDNHPVDDYLRDQCLRCHLWSSGHERDGDYRGSGCIACHMLYNNKGTYEGGDKAIPKDRRDRPQFHRITTKIPESQCISCHNRGSRIGVSFIGKMESDEYGTPWGTEPGKKAGEKLHGKYYNHLTADVHYEEHGMTCIDCHTKSDLHGDGNIYSKKFEAVEIECIDCHGTAESYSNLKTSWGNPLENLTRRGSEVILTTKMDGREIVVSQTKDVVREGSLMAQTSMGIPGHLNNMECFSCHARWAPQCYGCHVQQDLGEKSRDMITTKIPEDISKAGLRKYRGDTTFRWRESRSYLRWENPTLGINAEGKVSPFIPGCQAIFTQIGPDGEVRMDRKIFTTYDGLSGFSHNPVQPHTISTEARTCVDCHASRKAVGLGSGIYDMQANNIDLPFEFERIVDEDGNQLQATHQYGARPFNKEELQRIMRVNVCISCHKDTADPALWKKVTDVTGFAKTDEKHKEILKKIFDKGVKK